MAFEARKLFFFANIKIINVFFRVAVNTYVFRGLDARGGRNLRTDTHTHTYTHTNGTTTVTLVARMCAEG